MWSNLEVVRFFALKTYLEPYQISMMEFFLKIDKIDSEF